MAPNELQHIVNRVSNCKWIVNRAARSPLIPLTLPSSYCPLRVTAGQLPPEHPASETVGINTLSCEHSKGFCLALSSSLYVYRTVLHLNVRTCLSRDQQSIIELNWIDCILYLKRYNLWNTTGVMKRIRIFLTEDEKELDAVVAAWSWLWSELFMQLQMFHDSINSKPSWCLPISLYDESLVGHKQFFVTCRWITGCGLLGEMIHATPDLSLGFPFPLVLAPATGCGLLLTGVHHSQWEGDLSNSLRIIPSELNEKLAASVQLKYSLVSSLWPCNLPVCCRVYTADLRLSLLVAHDRSVLNPKLDCTSKLW